MVVVFDIGEHYRLITHMSYPKQSVHIARDDASEYDKERWKDEL